MLSVSNEIRRVSDPGEGVKVIVTDWCPPPPVSGVRSPLPLKPGKSLKVITKGRLERDERVLGDSLSPLVRGLA